MTWRKVRNFVLAAIFGAVLTLAVVWAGFNAAAREDQFRDDIRKERCARMGENIPKELEDYCNNLGV